MGCTAILRSRDVPERWVDSSRSHHYTLVRKHLRSLADERSDVRDWRPCTLVFVQRDPPTRHRMMTVASWLEGESGFTTAIRMVEGHGALLRRQAADIEADLRRELRDLSPGAYARVVQTDDLIVGVQALVQTHGIGTIEPNLALFGVYDLRNPPEDREEYGQMLQTCIRFGANVGVLSLREDAWEKFEATPPDQRTIALWWSDDQLGQLITLLGWLCKRHPDWHEAEIVAYVPVSDDAHETGRVEQLLHEARIKARVLEVDPTPAAFAHALGEATLALAPLRVRRGQALGPFDTPLGMLVEGLPLAVMVLATESLDLDAQPDESDLAELATLTDRAAETQRWIAELDAEAGRLLVKAEAMRIDLIDTKGAERADLEAAVGDADAQAATAYRAYVDARTRSNALIAQATRLADRGVGVQLDPDVWRSSSRRS